MPAKWRPAAKPPKKTLKPCETCGEKTAKKPAPKK
jgi:hypothetical protein